MGEANIDMVSDNRDNEAGGPDSQGFSASMSGLNLFEFVQMECMSGARRAIRVTSGNRIGYLFFGDGGITHALTSDAVGEVALLQVLKWHFGQLEQCALQPNDQARIRRPWQQLLLQAAQQEDESRRDRRDNLVEFPRQRSSAGAPALAPEPAPQSHLASIVPDSVSMQAAKDGVIGAVRVDPAGEVISSRGQSDELPGLGAYAVRLSELMGASLGIEQVKTIDARLARTRTAIKRSGDGSLVIVRAITQDTGSTEPARESSSDGRVEAQLAEVLGGLRDIEGVLGSFVIDASGMVVGLDLPKIFSQEVVAEVGKRLLRLRESFETQGDQLRSVEIRYAQQRVYARVCDSLMLGVLIVGSANMALVGMAAAVVGRHARAFASLSSSRPRLDSLPSVQVDAPSGARSGGARRTVQPPGAPGAAGGARSNRPVYFRGRRVR